MNKVWDAKQDVVVESIADFKKKEPKLFEQSILYQDDEHIRFCRIIDYQGILSGTFLVPKKEMPIQDEWAFAFCIDDQKLYFLGKEEMISELLENFEKRHGIHQDGPLMFLVALMLFLVENDVYFLEEYNRKLEELEEQVFDQHTEGMERFIMATRKDMEILSSYYLQMSVAAEALQRIIYEKRIEMSRFNSLLLLFETKVNQLHNFVDTIKSYTSQIWNLRQTQLSDRQNKITTVLTIITTIFLPLTLITGWFGMNFQDLPLIYTPNGYLIIAGIALVIVCLELIYIWTRNLFR